MKKILLAGFLACILFQTGFAQITPEQITGTWGLVGFDMKPKSKNGTLTAKEKETISTMQKALTKKPKFTHLTFKADGTFQSDANNYNGNITPIWELKDNIVQVKLDKKVVEKYYARIASNGWLELTAVKSKVAIPIMTFEKD